MSTAITPAATIPSALAGQWRKAGLKVAPAHLVGHCVTQVFYDNAWHLMDGDMHSIYLLRDNETVAGEQDLVRDHDLIRRTHTQGLLQAESRAGDEWESSIYVYRGEGHRRPQLRQAATLNLTLRPSEALVWRWGHLDPVKYHGARPPRFPDRVCNGLWEYRPDFTAPRVAQGATTVESIREGADGLAAEDGKPGVVVWTMRSPYVLVGGRLEVEGTGAKFALSWDGKSWHDVDRNLDGLFPPEGPARYAYHLRCQLTGEARLRRLGIVNDLQMAPLTLPEMGVGIEHVPLHRRVARPSAGADHPPVGRAVRQPAARSAVANRSLPPNGGSGRGDRHRLPVAARGRPRRRRDRRLPLRALREGRHEVAPLHELRQAHLPHGRRGPGPRTRCPAPAC